MPYNNNGTKDKRTGSKNKEIINRYRTNYLYLC